MKQDDLEKLRYDEWKYRHALVYNLMFRYMGAVIATYFVYSTQYDLFCGPFSSANYAWIIIMVIGFTGIIHMLVEFVRMIEARASLHMFDKKTEDKLKEINGAWGDIYYLIKTKVSFSLLVWPALVIFVLFVSYSAATGLESRLCVPIGTGAL